jgi:hypothetical protein
MADPENAPKHDQTSIEADDNGGAQSDANGQTVEPIVAISTRKWADEHDYEPMALFTKVEHCTIVNDNMNLVIQYGYQISIVNG